LTATQKCAKIVPVNVLISFACSFQLDRSAFEGRRDAQRPRFRSIPDPMSIKAPIRGSVLFIRIGAEDTGPNLYEKMGVARRQPLPWSDHFRALLATRWLKGCG